MFNFNQLREAEEKRKKAIPSQMFFNHFFAIDYHLQANTEKYRCKNVAYYNSLRLRNSDFSLDDCRKLLWNSWSTEYAFLLTGSVDSDEYYKFALHWNFPQAYYSVYLNMTAFHQTQGIANDQHEKSIKIFGNSIKDGHYPSAISFFAKGLHKQFEFHGLPDFQNITSDFNGLAKIRTPQDSQIQIAKFLKSTREKNADHKREKLEQSKDRRFFNANGNFRKSFTSYYWNLIYSTIPETTILNLMYRLRIKANYHDVESFINADIDFKVFHECLGRIIDYLNFVHESYLVKVIGATEYETILNGFPNHMNEDTALKRYNSHIKSI